jgi:SAM-dependent methyltransferase
MRSPWLEVPLADYEAHMALPAIDQARLIADQLEASVTTYRPNSVAVVGCAGGNGFNRLTSRGVDRVVGVDINPHYIAQARDRYQERIDGLELHVADIQASGLLFEPVDLLYVALVLEYVDVAQALSSLSRHCKAGGVVATLCQLPHETMAHVSPSPYTSLQVLAPRMRFVSPEELLREAERVRLLPESPSTILSAGGKQFRYQPFRRPTRAEARL